MENFILHTSIFFTGVTVTCVLFLFLFGQKSIGTRFHALFFAYLTLFLISLVMVQLNIPFADDIQNRMHYMIPSFYLLFIAVQNSGVFRYKYLLSFALPFPLLFMPPLALFSLMYHAAAWTVLIYATIKLFSDAPSADNRENAKHNYIVFLLVGLCILPFIAVNLIVIFVYKKDSIVLAMFPPAAALTVVLDLYFSYKINLTSLDHSYYANIDFIRKSMASEKKTLIEKLSAGLIHEIKNPVTAIQSINQQLLCKVDNMNKDDIKRYLDVISDETDRIKELTESYLKNFRNFSNGRSEKLKFQETLESVIKLMSPELKRRNCSINIDISCGNIDFTFNSSEFRQIMINLFYNSIEAGTSEIVVSAVRKQDVFEIFIKDNGSGVDNLTEDQIFKPFYTTKFDGTGLGLSISREIINNYLGQLELYKSDGMQTIFKLTVPEGEE